MSSKTDIEPIDPDSVSYPCLAWQNMSKDWDLIHSLMGGTKSMREGGEKWLPREYKEKEGQYRVRLERSFLMNAFKDAVNRLVSKPFSREVVLVKPETIPERLLILQNDVDKTGTSITQFCRDVMKNSIQYGLTHVLVDFPIMPKSATKADEDRLGARPVLVEIPATHMIGFESEVDDSGNTTITEIRYLDFQSVKDGKWGQKEKLYIRRITSDQYETYEYDPDKNINKAEAWTLIPEKSGYHTFKRVPIATFYTNKTGFMEGKCPLIDLAYLNLAHYQTSSDFRNGVRFTTHGLLMLTGLTEEEFEKTVNMGPTSVFKSTNSEAKGEYVEHQGRGLGTCADYLSEIENQMESLGMQPMTTKSGDATATGRVIDEARSFTDIQVWIRSLELTLLKIFGMGASWLKQSIGTDFRVNINNDFGINLKDSGDRDILDKARTRGDITQECFLMELQRRGTLREELNIADEIAKTKEEGPPLSLLGEMSEDQRASNDEKPGTNNNKMVDE